MFKFTFEGSWRFCLGEKGMATHSSILAWRIPWPEEPSVLQSIGSQRVRYDLVTEQQQSYVTLGKLLLCVLAYSSVERTSYSACLLRFLQKLIGLKCAKQSANYMI